MKHIKAIILGVLFAALLLPAPTYAQFTVYDPISNINQVRSFFQDLQHWVETVQQYEQTYLNAVNQLTTTKGLLKNAEDMLNFDQKTRTTISDLGKTVRLSFKLKSQIENLIVGQFRAYRDIRSRLRSGIFSPAQDAADMEEYLKYGIGRTSQDTISEQQRLIKMDNRYERLQYDMQLASAKAAELSKQIADKQAEIEALQNCDTCTEKDRDLEKLSFDLQKMQAQQHELEKQATDLFDASVKRSTEIYAQEDQRRVFGRDIQTLKGGWDNITKAKEWARATVVIMSDK